jgi:hypothetical protein
MMASANGANAFDAKLPSSEDSVKASDHQQTDDGCKQNLLKMRLSPQHLDNSLWKWPSTKAYRR